MTELLLEDLNKEIVKRPYQFITGYMEDRLPYTGGEVFERISLIPPSLILPDFAYKGDMIRSNINVLLIGSSSSGKSTITKEFLNLAYYPLSVKSITPAMLERKIRECPTFTLIVDDFSRMIRDPIIVKIIEGILGEEKRIQRATMRSELDLETDACGLFCGTSQDLSSYLTGGFLQRTVPIIIHHNEKEHSDIGKNIIKNMGKRQDGIKRQVIGNYYNKLFKIQLGQNKNVNPVIDYYQDPKMNEEAYEIWDERTKKINEILKTQLNWFRELHEFFRFMYSHAMLNIFNRKVNDGILYPEKDDFNVGIKLMEQTIKLKYDVLSMSSFSKTISDLRELQLIMDSNKLSQNRKEILRNLLEIKKGKIKR